MIMIFQLSDWFPKPMIWAIIVKFDQIRKNWWRISCAEILKLGKENVTIWGGFTRRNQGNCWKFTKTVILLGLAGYERIITNSAYGLVGCIYQLISGASSLVAYISSYPARPRRITVKYVYIYIYIYYTILYIYIYIYYTTIPRRGGE